MRLFALALLTMVSMGAWAQIDVQIAKDGTFDGGTIKYKDQTKPDEKGFVTVTITVTPDKKNGYTISKNDITVVSTYPPTGLNSGTRTPEIAETLTLYYNGSEKEDIKDLSVERDYTFIVPSGFGAWVKEAKFSPKGRKGPGDEESVDFGRSGTYYIGTIGYNASTPAKNFYLCPTEGWCYYEATDDFTGTDNGMPFITTYNCKTNGYHSGNSSDAVWYVEKHPTQNYYYIKQASTGRYLTSNGEIRTTGNPDRMRVHLESVAPENLDDKELFTIAEYSTYLTISPKGVVGGAADRNWLTVNGGNKLALTGQSGKTGGPTGYANTAGIIGVYTQNDANAPFYLEEAISITPPIITNHFTKDDTFTITTAEGATIYYTTDGTTPTTSTATTGTTSVNIPQTEGMTVIKALAKATNDNFPTPVVTYVLPICERPTITVSGGTVTITCPTAGATVHYTTNGDPATSTSTTYAGPFAKGSASEIRAIATKAGYVISSEIVFMPPTEVSSSSEITDMNGNYILASNFSSSGSVGSSGNPFKGTIDGNMVTISGLGHPLVAYAIGATIKNVILDNVSISSGTNVGAICGEATGDTRIYNCGVLGGSVGGSNNVGGIVGLLDGRSRVINCYNYANITSGSNCGGIVGYNNVASTSGNLQTMVMNCMFYGNITGGNAAPIYGGKNIHNKYASTDDTGLNNYCYFLYDEEKTPYVTSIADGNYHGALGAEERFLNRFEFFRMTLNSTRNLAAYYVTGDATQKGEMAKWVLDKSIAPYPILKVQDKYPSVVNPDAAHATTQTDRNKGGLLGTLSVTIGGTGSGKVFGAPTGASITTTSSLTLNITDKDEDNFNFNYKKVQLPYYNEVGTGNYTKASDGTGRVVTGWKITSITGGTPGSFKTDTYDYPSFNFVDRKCTNKDLYSVSGRVFAQGAYWEVPDEVTAITIEPYWAKAVYLSDANYDVTYSGATKYGVTVGGDCPSDYKEQQVYNAVSNAITALASDASHTVYDYAVVLVGNYHQYADAAIVNNGKPVTFMSADLDGDNEPDNTLFYYHKERQSVSPMRFDFLNIPGIGMVKRTHDATMDPEPGIFAPTGWFEITNTVFIRFGQFEYAGSNKDHTKTIMAPLILQGGIYEQFVSCCRTNAQKTNYLHVGGNAWFKNFANGCHTAQANKTPKVPVNVTGGDYTNFYLTGIYQPAATQDTENAECYIDGGRFSEVAGSGMQQVNGDVTWLINAADITSFYGGGINAAKPITGSISTTISNSYVDKFYGGPKFGDMYEEKTVTTNATDCHFGKFFGAGYGGTAFNRVGCEDDSKADNSRGWDSWVTKYYKRAYDGGNGGISTNYDYEFILHSDGKQTVARFFVNYASLSLASTRNVTNTLSGCTIGTFYGGGSLGAVNGDVNSTLTNCTVTGNAFGAGFSASVPTVEVWNAGANLSPNPKYNRTANVFNNASVKTPKDNNQFVVYTWSNTYGTNTNPFTDEDGKHYIHTDVSLDGLGSVTGKATLTINGTTTVGESVYGGGEESGVGGDTEVTVTGGTIGTTGKGGATWGNVYGGGKGKEKDVTAGLVKGNATVSISGSPTILHNVYGGGAYGSVGTFTYADDDYHTAHPEVPVGMPTALATANTGACTVTITGGTFGSDGKENGMVFGSSRGDVAVPEGEPAVDPNDRMAWVYSTHVTIGDAGAAMSPTIKGSVYGSGENGHTFQNTIVDIKKGIIGITDTNVDGGAAYAYRGNVYGGGCGTDMYDSNDDTTKDAYNPLAGIVKGTTTINIAGGQVVHNVYGAGAMGSVGGGAEDTSGKTTINITGGRIGYDGDGNGHVFGAARGEFGKSTAASGLANVRETEVNINYATTPAADNADKNVQLIAGSVFGGGEAGTVKESVAVKMTGGLVLKDVYGGGALADTQTSNWDANANSGAGNWATGKTSASTTTTVRLTGGTILGEAYGGGLGEAGKPAYVYGDVLLDLNGTTTSGETGTAIAVDAKGCAVGQIFGCNNINGTPKGDVMVHVYATQNKDKEATQIANTTEVTTAKVKGRYDVTAVYGGGNLAAYEPEGGKNTTKSTKVIIDGCGLTSIQTVYGGGNAASTPATNVTVNGTFEIEELFGGGNGKEALPNGDPNPGANVGFYAYKDDATDAQTPENRAANYGYGSGKASINVFGGTIHRVFGGSNTKGNVRQTAVTLLDENSGCTFCVDEAYGGGKSAPMDAEAKLLMACIPGLQAAYGGAEAADIQSNVTLNITNGTFDRVFGGNNLSGTIRGSITVNIEEVGCKPVKIGELYGGGNQAGYSVYGYDSEGKPVESGTTPLYNDPQVNVKSFTSIGKVFGGGFGSDATMVGNPTVNVNEVYGRYYNDDVSVVGENAKTPFGYPIPSHTKGKMGAISEIFGGGNAAKVIGNTTVNIGTLEKVSIRSFEKKDVNVGASVEGLYIRSGEGTGAKPYTYTAATGTAVEGTTYYEEKNVENDVLGVDIRGNVYGGGNNAEVTGNTNVVIGKRSE